MEYETVSADDFGASLTGLGMNILVRDVRAQTIFLTVVFGMTAHRVSDDFAIMRYGSDVFQLHSDGTYHAHPLPSLLPEAGPRGGGAEFRLYETDPDEAVARAKANDGHILADPTNKPHGLREAYILCENGYAWVPSRRLSQTERTKL